MDTVPKNLAAALVRAWRNIGHAPKTAENTFLHSMYADLRTVIDTVKSALLAEGICVLQPASCEPLHVDGKFFHVVTITNILLHESGESYQWKVSGRVEAPGPQPIGSMIAYLRRYSLTSGLCVGFEDEDGEVAQQAEVYVVKDQPKPEQVRTVSREAKVEKKVEEEKENVQKVKTANKEKAEEKPKSSGFLPEDAAAIIADLPPFGSTREDLEEFVERLPASMRLGATRKLGLSWPLPAEADWAAAYEKLYKLLANYAGQK